MEKDIKNLYYIGIDSRDTLRRHRARERKRPLGIYRHDRSLPFESGSISLYHSLLPAFFEEEIQNKRWRKKWMMRLLEAREYVEEKLNVHFPEETVFSEKLCNIMGEEIELPLVLFSAGLKRLKARQSFAHVSISLPEECGAVAAENVVELLHPYLSKINYVVFVGEESESAAWVEDYLYGEYGIVMSYDKRPEKNTVWLDLGEKKSAAMEEFASGNGIRHLCRGEMLKFLDTMVKNEYNTKIN